MNEDAERSAETESSNHEVGTISGRWVIVGMFVFAIVLTGTLWIYWKMHVGPFVPLQKLLVSEFPGSQPRVEGGQRKIHKRSPKILRITMKVDFDPTSDKMASERFAKRVETFVRDVWSLDGYEILEFHFFWPDPEKTMKTVTIERKLNGEEPKP